MGAAGETGQMSGAHSHLHCTPHIPHEAGPPGAPPRWGVEGSPCVRGGLLSAPPLCLQEGLGRGAGRVRHPRPSGVSRTSCTYVCVFRGIWSSSLPKSTRMKKRHRSYIVFGFGLYLIDYIPKTKPACTVCKLEWLDSACDRVGARQARRSGELAVGIHPSKAILYTRRDASLGPGAF